MFSVIIFHYQFHNMIPDSKPTFLAYLHSFRGFAIINIAAIHAIGFATFHLDPRHPVPLINELVFHNSTIYFALISGLLFTVVLKEKGYEKFYGGKFKYVVLPYLFFTLVFSVFVGRPGHWFDLQPDMNSYLKDVVRNFLFGKASFVYWYIPVLFFLYLVTPVLDFIMNIKKWGVWAMAFIMAAPLVVRRVELTELMKGDFLSIENMIYFMGAYAVGMFLASNLEAGIEWIRKYRFFFMAIVIVSSAAILYATLQSIDRIGALSILSALYYIQKLAIGGLVLLLLKNIGEQQPIWLHPIAKSAFTIYFLHVFFIAILFGYIGPITVFQELTKFSGLLAGVLILVLAVALSMMVALMFRKLGGKYSRMLIGS
jgi:surface polysaccharide O-acyltransferase-like enzyme